MNNTFYIIVIVIVSYFLLIFISPSVADNIGNTLGIKHVNQEIRDFKSGLDFFSTDEQKLTASGSNAGVNQSGEVRDIQGGIIEARDIIVNKIDETKTDIDATRKAVEETNKNIQKTQDSINSTLESIDQVQTSVKKVAE